MTSLDDIKELTGGELFESVNQWVCYSMEYNSAKNRYDKVPLNPKNGHKAAVNDPTTWCSYKEACLGKELHNAAGVGFVLTTDDPYICIDLDHCYDAETCEMSDAAKDIISHFPATYMEISPSGTGLHIWAKGVKPGNKCKREIEMYDHGHYMTYTGKPINGSVRTISEAQEAIDYVYGQYLESSNRKDNKEKTVETPQHVIEAIRKHAAFAETFNVLYKGDWEKLYADQSSADWELVRIVTKFANGNPNLTKDILMGSGMVRDKWNEIHSADGQTYIDLTINNAVNSYKKDKKNYFGGFIREASGCYLYYKGEEPREITNFVIRPNYHTFEDNKLIMNATAITRNGEEVVLEFCSSDLANKQAFKRMLSEKSIALGYTGTDDILEQLKEYLWNLDWTDVESVNEIGLHLYHGEWVYVDHNGAIDKYGKPVSGMVLNDSRAEIKSNLRKGKTISDYRLRNILSAVVGYNDTKRTVIVLAWIAAAFLNAHFEALHLKLPHLCLVGEAGSGKSTVLERVIAPIFGSDDTLAIGQFTQFTSIKSVGSSNIIPLLLDEFKPSKLTQKRKEFIENFLRSSYDHQDVKRGRSDLTTVKYRYKAPVVIAGEESLGETALRERSVEVLYTKATHTTAYQETLNTLLGNEDVLLDLGFTLLMTAMDTTVEEVENWYVAPANANAALAKYPARVQHSAHMLYCGISLVEKMCFDYSLSLEEVLGFSKDSAIACINAALYEYLLDSNTHNPSIVEETLAIISRMDRSILQQYCIRNSNELLEISLYGLYDDYTKYVRDHAIKTEVLDLNSFRKQLKVSDLYLGSTGPKRLGGGLQVKRCYIIDLKKLGERVEVMGFEELPRTP